MATRFRKHRLRRVIYWILGIFLFALAWKAFWWFGPALRGGAPEAPAMFEVQARVLLKANLNYPRRVEAVLPAQTPLEIELVWEPPWTPERMSEAARRVFGWQPER